MNPFQFMIAVLAAAAAAATSTSSPTTTVTTPGLMTEWPSDKWPTSTFSTAVPGPTSIKDDYYEKTDLADLERNGKCAVKEQTCEVKHEGETYKVQCGQGGGCDMKLWEKHACRQDGDDCHVFGLGTNRTLPDYFAHCHFLCHISVGMNEYYEGNRSKPIFGPLTHTWTAPVIHATNRPRPTQTTFW